jgi:predicted outer membrane repeat protein
LGACALALFCAVPASAATFTVTNGNDTGGGSLRDAITQAEGNANDPMVDLIQFNPSVTEVDLDSVLPSINHPLTIDGPGAGQLNVTRSSSASTQFRFFAVTPGTGTTITIGDMTISGARATAFAGGALIMAGLGNLVIDRIAFDDNQAPGGSGGAILFQRGFTSIRNSTLSNNQADFGGAIVGSQFVPDIGNGEIVNSTIAGNKATSFGGGVYTNVSQIQILSSTIVGNVANSDDSGAGGGGGTYKGGAGAVFAVANTLYAGNKVGTASPVDDQCGGAHTSSGYNLRETSEAGCTGFIQTGDMVDASAAMLGSLGSNGGPTPTIPLTSGNFAIDHGNDALAIGSAFPACPATDQRGFLRGGTAGRCDIGAFEVGAMEPPPAGGGGAPPLAASGPTSQRAPAIRKCKRKFPKGPKRKKCIKKAKKRFPV